MQSLRVEEGELKSAFAGMGKEELMKYANDPFWIRIRWFLFILFWLSWLGMLIGAIAIIYKAPKCLSPESKQWWEEGPLAEIKADISPDNLKELKDSGIKALIVEWSDDIYDKINDSHRVISLMEKGKELDLPIILDFEASMSNIWFENSENGGEYSDYYIWKESDKVNASGAPIPPNNWISRRNESSWKFSAIRKEFYYAPEGWPQLNFRNDNVTEEFASVLKKFSDKGARGFRIRDAHLLLVDPQFKDQEPDKSNEVTEKGYFLNDYGFYVHSKTENLLELGPLLKKWRKVAKNVTNNGPFMVKNIGEKVEAYKVNGVFVVDLPAHVNIFHKAVFEPEKIVHTLEYIFKTLQFQWPLWAHKSNSLPQDVQDSVTYLLPGVPLLEGGATVNQELLKLRSLPPILQGEFACKAVANNSVLAFTRLTSGSPAILVAVNPLNETVTVNLEKDMNSISSELTVQFISTNFNESNYKIGLKKEANNILISPKASIVLTYTPKKDE
ncbi:neutral and basic amino acid transport protein rBAT isoform X2 [Coccinella septempunctata]|uniref:neutral and basic amino acid transport protein rBAT isoform X2 n=1 Tax=Coccinella septempunctata TaxID=41139 RepID=UPI001D05CA03|nr:neutral and basic amino acid transport protein rBAT isoform X2 [Coccinella septempunctata]